MVLQCLAWIWAFRGSLESYVCANIGPLVFFSLFTCLEATFLGICQALLIVESSKRLGYPPFMSCFLISCGLWSPFSGSLHIQKYRYVGLPGSTFLAIEEAQENIDLSCTLYHLVKKNVNRNIQHQAKMIIFFFFYFFFTQKSNHIFKMCNFSQQIFKLKILDRVTVHFSRKL